MKHRVEKILQIREELATLPEVGLDQKELLNTKEAVTLMADVLAELQKKGYTVDMIGKLLHGQGVMIAQSTLQRYLQPSVIRRATKNRGASARTKRPPPLKVATKDAVSTDPPPTPALKGAFGVRGDTEDL